MSEAYAGQAAEKAARAKARRTANGGYPSKRAAKIAEYRRAIRHAIKTLESSHIQDNKFRMGVLGAQDIIHAIATLRRTLTP